ncbi:MAG: hypothetical protein KF681_16070 [Bdellovibrionaceae bacterium]|nr:hypothetical protein [Pseudobdellovibrionaceae bacterium]
MIRSIALSTFAFTLLLSNAGHADYQWGFGNISLNHLDWSQGTEDKSTKKDFTYLEIEGGAQHTWGELYGFFDIENVGKTGDDVRTASKANLRYYLGQTGFSVYAHAYAFSALGFSEQNRVLGLGYQVGGEGWSFKPFLGFHDVSQTYFSGSNGYMGGWVLIYIFKIKGHEFMFADWHEYEFDRKEAYAAGNGASKVSHNGAASIWWTAVKEMSLGLQYRYAQDKLGTPGSQSAVISTIRYNF